MGGIHQIHAIQPSAVQYPLLSLTVSDSLRMIVSDLTREMAREMATCMRDLPVVQNRRRRCSTQRTPEPYG